MLDLFSQATPISSVTPVCWLHLYSDLEILYPAQQIYGSSYMSVPANLPSVPILNVQPKDLFQQSPVTSIQ